MNPLRWFPLFVGTAFWPGGIGAAENADGINWHEVNFVQGFRAGTVAWMLTRDPRHLASAERNYQTAIGTHGQFAGGTFVPMRMPSFRPIFDESA